MMRFFQACGLNTCLQQRESDGVGDFFPPDYGDLEITLYSDDLRTASRKLRFSVPETKWDDFKKSDVFKGLETADFVRDLTISAFYSDNAIYCREVSFYVNYEKWSELEKKSWYRQLVEFVKQQEIPGRPPRHHGGGLEWEIDGSFENPSFPGHRVSFWDKVRRLFRNN